MGTLALEIETGRYTITPVKHSMCSCGTEVENEEHLLLWYPQINSNQIKLYLATDIHRHIYNHTRHIYNHTYIHM